MAKINKVRLSGQTYDIEDANAQPLLSAGTGIQISGNVISATGSSGGGSPTVELTQAEYDALVSGGTVQPNTYYIITDAQAIDISQYYTSAQTNSAIAAAVSGKQDTLVSGTNIKTINNESILGSGNIDIQGGGVNVVQTTGTSTTDVMSQDAVTTAINEKADKSTAGGGLRTSSTNNYDILQLHNQNSQDITGYYNIVSFSKINDEHIIHQGSYNPNSFSLVETSAITTSISSSSTDAQVPSAKAVYDKFDEVEQVTAAGLNALNDNFGGMKLVKLTQAEYNALTTKDSSTLYIIVN